MKCKDCTVFGCQYRTTDAEKDCYYETQYTAKEQFDWQSFRNQAAKDILCAMIELIEHEYSAIDKDYWCGYAVEWTDALVKKLKEKEA